MLITSSSPGLQVTLEIDKEVAPAPLLTLMIELATKDRGRGEVPWLLLPTVRGGTAIAPLHSRAGK